MSALRVTPWHGPRLPTREALERILREEGLEPRWWSNAPGDRLDLPPETPHAAGVAPSGVTCVEQAKS